MTERDQSKLDDLHLVLLSTASQRKEGSLIPAPKSVSGDSEAVHRALALLLERGLADEVAGAKTAQTWREDAGNRIGLRITEAGIALLDSGPTEEANEAVATPLDDRGSGPKPRSGSKQARVIDLLSRPEGATLDELVTATGWLPHTTRAAITGLRKRGHKIHIERRDGISRYVVGEAA